ncbi:MAG: shikimate dehydrogenase [Bacteroidaceae bacterium]|nr:shikimate dehydrogenase [Prevotellaceae bacterium]MDY5760752.1 shikimate dehydrogenase [Bacteroidaceae bacterium]
MTTYGLIGYPLGHSFSRKFFTEKFEKEGIDAQYLNFEIPSIEEFPEIIKNNPELRGLNVTIPYKQQVMQYLDEISEEAKAIGAVNVVRIERPSPQPTPIMGRETMRNAGNKPDGLPIKGDMSEGLRGSLIGYNSDVIGFVESIRPLLKAHHKKALILGTGGASKAIRYGLEKKLGMKTLFVSRSAREGMITYEEVTAEVLKEYEVIVNCSPVGMYPHVDECPALPYEAMNENNLLYDLVYNPLETLFMKKGAEQGATVKNGLEMLHLQAIASWKFWEK